MTKKHGKMVCGERGGMEEKSVTILFYNDAPLYKHADTDVSEYTLVSIL
jgi:hypothetical protein